MSDVFEAEDADLDHDAVEAVAKLFGREPPTPVVEPPRSEMARRLLDEYANYDRDMHKCPGHRGNSRHARGSLVTPRVGTHMTDQGVPFLVLETFLPSETDPLWADSYAGTMRDGLLANMRIGRWTDRGMVAIWVESWVMEPYTGEIAS